MDYHEINYFVRGGFFIYVGEINFPLITNAPSLGFLNKVPLSI